MQDNEEFPVPQIEDLRVKQTEAPEPPFAAIDVLREVVQQYDEAVNELSEIESHFTDLSFMVAMYQKKNGPISLDMTMKEFHAVNEGKSIDIAMTSSPDGKSILIQTKIYD
jgi:hypothetical protein